MKRVHGLMLVTLLAVAPAVWAQSEEKEKPQPKPSLQEQLDARREAFNEMAPEEMKAAFEQGVAEVADSGVMESAKQVGDKAPDFTLPNHAGEPVQLQELLKAGPVVLTWYRGGWCPYCNVQLQAYQEALPAWKALGAQLVALSPETPDYTEQTVEKGSLAFTVLSDAGNAVARDYGVVYTLPEVVLEKFEGRIDLTKFNGDDKNELPLAVTYVIDSEGIIRYAFVDEDYRKRAEPAAITEALEGL
jgi:peroxiredoxin